MASKYIIDTKNVTDLTLLEFEKSLPHNFKEAPTVDRQRREKVIVLWIMKGPRGATMKLSYKNNRGTVVIVKESKINNDDGEHYSGARLVTP